MSFFDRIFKKKQTGAPDIMADLLRTEGFDYVLKAAELISGNDASVMEKIGECIENTPEFLQKNRERYSLWAIDPDASDKETLVLTGFIDELSDAGYLFPTNVEAELDSLIEGISSLRTFKTMDIDISYIQFDEERTVLDWCRVINEELKDIRQLCCVDIGGEDFNLVWLNNETIQEIASVTENTEISLEAVGIKQY